MSDRERKIGAHSPAVMQLAQKLYEKMEQLDPGSGGGTSWDELPDRDVDFYATTVEEVIEEDWPLLMRVLADYDVVLRHSKLPEKVD